MEKLYIVSKTRPGVDCGSDHELLIAKFRLKLKTTRPFRYDLNKIPYDYTVEVSNRFKGLDLIDRVPDELWTEIHDSNAVKFSSVTQSCLTLCDPTNHSMPGLPVHHQLPEFTQTQVD